MYRCAAGDCGRRIEFDTNTLGLRCPYCGRKVFFKERPTVAKRLTAR